MSQTLVKQIMDQDRENIYEVWPESIFYVEQTFFAFNVMMDTGQMEFMLGTFDSLTEGLEEVQRIYNSQDTFFEVSGYSNDVEGITW